MAKAKAKTTTSFDKTTTSGGQSGTNGPDAQTQAYINSIMGAAQGAGGQVPASVQNALGFLSGDPNATNSYMNPYQSQVIDGYLNDMNRANALTGKSMSDQFTKSGAFGGSRQAVATAVAAGENQRNTGNQIAGLRAQGYNDATNRAMSAANLGMQAGSPDLWRMMMLKAGFTGLPFGTQYQNRNNQATTNAGGSFTGDVRVGA